GRREWARLRWRCTGRTGPAGEFPDGQLYVNLRGYDPDQPVPAAEALAGFLRALGVSGADVPQGKAERAARDRALLARQRVRVVLNSAATVEEVRPRPPDPGRWGW